MIVRLVLGLCVELVPFGLCCFPGTSAMVPRAEIFVMNIDSLKNCIETLERVRDAHYNQLDTSVQAELDEVIAALKKGLDENQPDMGRLSARVLRLIEHIVSLVTNITDWMG